MAFETSAELDLFFDDFGVDVTYSSPAYAGSHDSSKTTTYRGIFMREWVEYNGIGGLKTTLRTKTDAEEGARITYIEDDGTTTDYYVRGSYNTGTDLYTWILERI